MNTKYLSGAETAKLVRLALKEAFPGVKFGVRSDYNSVNVSWTDGPNEQQVETITHNFVGGSFDSSEDILNARAHTLDGQPAHFANFLFTRRDFSEALINRALRAMASKYQCAVYTVADYNSGALFNVLPIRGSTHGNSLQELVRKYLHKMTDRTEVAESATVKRVALVREARHLRGVN